MSDTENQKIRVRAVREFTDATTETRRDKGAEFDVDAGTLENYAAAGLVTVVVRKPTSDDDALELDTRA